MTFGESRTVYIHDAVANFPTSVLDGAGEAVKGSGAAEGEEVCSGFGDADSLSPELHTRHAPVPVLSHKLQSVGWISDDSVNGIRKERG